MDSGATNDFLSMRGDGWYGWARPEAEEWILRCVGAFPTLHAAAGGHPEVKQLQGRGKVFSIPSPLDTPATGKRANQSAAPWVVRHYFRGGAVSSLLGDRYLRLGAPRPYRELRASERTRSEGVSTPRVIAALVYPTLLFYRGDLVTEEIRETKELAEVLFGAPRSSEGERVQALRSAVALIDRLASRRIFHPDLNVKNLLLGPNEQGLEAHVLDLDRVSFGVGGADKRMKARLARSIRKWEGSTGLPLSSAEEDMLRSWTR